jgi:hypothetical protein
MKNHASGLAMLTRFPLLACVLPLLLVDGCGAGLPNFQEASGVVDEPCVASSTVSHCTAHVYVVNHGVEGTAHTAIVVLMKDSNSASSSARIANPTCGTAIPDTAAGGSVDLTCEFDLPPGKKIAGPPMLTGIDSAVAKSPGSSTDQTSGIVTIILAGAAALLALATLALSVAGRRRVAGAPARPTVQQEATADEEDDSSW